MSAVAPQSIDVDLTGGSGMDVAWKDGHKSHYAFQYLRDACPCALCDEEREKDGRRPGQPPKPAGALPMYKDPAKPISAAPVGKYAISFVWNDGHHQGIYSWEWLRSVCPCEECMSVRPQALR